MKTPQVAVTGLGVVSSVGIGWPEFWQGLLQGRSGIKEISYLDNLDDFTTRYGGEVTGFNPGQFMPEDAAKRLGRGSQFAVAATKMALEDANLVSFQSLDAAVGVCLGTTMADIQALEEVDSAWVAEGERAVRGVTLAKYPSCVMSANVARHFGFSGPNIMIPTACSAGNYALAYGTDLIRAGRADIMVVGGADPFSRIAFTGFSRLFALAPERCQPFDRNRQGTLIGEGAGILILERLDAARARGARVYAEVLGFGLSCDGHHMTIPEPDGVERVIRMALADADLAPEDVDYISAHGTGTPANDRTECAAIRRVFGGYTDHLPVSSIKSMLGHTMGAASALEAIACVLAIHDNQVPPTINYEVADPECAVDCVPGLGRRQEVRVALNNSFAFGGNNACVALAGY